MKTKSRYKFLMRSAHFDADLELVDGISIMQNQGKLYTTGTPYLFDFIDSSKHTRLANRINSSHNRRIAVNHLKNTLYSSYIKDLYEELTEYLQNILKAAASNGFDPNRLVGNHKVSFDANSILQAGSWQAVIDMVSEAIFRRLESEKSTLNLLKRMNDKLNLGVDENVINNALPYLEMRHLLVHADGVADVEFCNKYPTIRNTPQSKLKLNDQLIKSARDNVYALVEEYDQKVLHNSVVASNEIKE